MEGFGIALAALLLFAFMAMGLAFWMRSRMETQTTELRREMQALLQSQAQSMGGQLGQLTQSVTQQLGQMQQALQQGVADTGKRVVDAHQAMADQLARIGQELGQVQEAGRQLSNAADTMQSILGGAKTRGMLGELTLERLLADTLPQASFEMQYRFSTGSVVDAILRVGDKVVPVDSKFPLEAFRRLSETGEEARKEFTQAVRKHADSIAEKYILPAEGTLDYALMFVPSESVYYELLMTEDARLGRLPEYCLSQRVIPVSPNTLYAYLGVILLGLRGMQIEENARKLLDGLEGLKKQLDGFADIYQKLGTHLRNAQQSYVDAEGRLERAQVSLETMTQGALPEVTPKSLETAAKN